jgi:hypothetical protein
MPWKTEYLIQLSILARPVSDTNTLTVSATNNGFRDQSFPFGAGEVVTHGGELLNEGVLSAGTSPATAVARRFMGIPAWP